MRTVTLVSVAFLTALALSGCTGSGDGTLTVQATDAPDNLGDFSSLTIEVSSIDVTGPHGVQSYTPATSSFDLTKLASGNTTTLFHGSVANGTYSKVEFVIAKATGVLKSSGQSVDVGAPKGSIFLPQQFTVGAGQETTFLFDIHVVAKGNGAYALAPNAGGSRVH